MIFKSGRNKNPIPIPPTHCGPRHALCVEAQPDQAICADANDVQGVHRCGSNVQHAMPKHVPLTRVAGNLPRPLALTAWLDPVTPR